MLDYFQPNKFAISRFSRHYMSYFMKGGYITFRCSRGEIYIYIL